jgi:hypothetical protein
VDELRLAERRESGLESDRASLGCVLGGVHPRIVPFRGRRGGPGRVPGVVAVRAPHLYPLLRGFVLGSFVVLGRDLEEGAELPFAFEEHVERRGPSLYELRPLVRAFIEQREPVLRAREDARLAVEELVREPAAAIFARAHASRHAGEEEALFRTVLLGLLISTAEACGGFDWDDEAFERSYAELESSLFGERRRYLALAPLVGISTAKAVELGPGLVVRAFVSGELSTHWPESRGLLPRDFGREPDRLLAIELRSELDAGESPPDAPAETADAVSALRLTTAAAVAAGPVLFETLDGRPFGIQPVLPIAATQPPGESSRLDAFRTPIAAEVLGALGDADGDPGLADALDRWELSLFQNEPFRGEQLRAALSSLLGDTWPMRCCVLLGEDAKAREELYGELTVLAAGDAPTSAALDAARRAVVAVLRSRDRDRLVLELDRELLGLDRRPAPHAVAV